MMGYPIPANVTALVVVPKWLGRSGSAIAARDRWSDPDQIDSYLIGGTV
jgi:hypothetical protein